MQTSLKVHLLPWFLRCMQQTILDVCPLCNCNIRCRYLLVIACYGVILMCNAPMMQYLWGFVGHPVVSNKWSTRQADIKGMKCATKG